MKVIKCINNNVAIALDSTNKEVVIFGKGVGFKKPPFEIELNQIDRTYYNVDDMYISMINDLPSEIIEVSSEIINYARNMIDNLTSSNIVFSLADHINFAITRTKKNIKINLPILYDVEQLFEKEYKVGEYGLKLIRDKLHVYIPKEEAAYIALHIINAEEQLDNITIDDSKIIEDITNIVEKDFNFKIDKKTINYSRFVSHIQYLLKRGKSKHLIKSDNDKLYKTVIKEYPITYNCTIKIKDYLLNSLNLELTDEELLYLILHINRLCNREDCNQ